jgi:septal ring factor EnvC (AmiA/AmiB activator)
MIRIPTLRLAAVALLIPVLAPLGAARAQDVVGIELCSAEKQMDRRTGCLQSNIDYLHKLIGKNAADAQQKLNAANGQIGELKSEVAALKTEIAALKTALAAQQARIDKLTPPKPAVPLDKPAADKPAAK